LYKFKVPLKELQKHVMALDCL